MTQSNKSQLARILVFGATGRMGQAVIRSIFESPQASLAGALVRTSSISNHQPIANIFGATAPDQKFISVADPISDADVLIDFSGIDSFDAALALAQKHKLAFVSGTTGLSEAQRATLQQAAQTIPVLWSANFSLGMAMLKRSLREVAAALPEWDCDILEMHHRRKQDAPSGTALALGEAVAQGRKIELGDHAVYTRDGQIGPRKPGEIGFATLRGGDVVGEHTVIFASDGERLEFTHRATNRDIFARGALTAAIWLAGRKPGLYTFDQVLDSDR